MRLTTDKKARKEMPLARGLMDYFPNALAEVAHVSFVGNQQHNPGPELHWSRGKSDDHADCIVRHLIERGSVDDDGVRHSAKLAWRALANLQIEIENAEPSKPGPRPTEIIFADPRKDDLYQSLMALGCPSEVADQITEGTRMPVTAGEGPRIDPFVYVAGPMRGYEHFNFPAFDAARDALLAKGFNVISPADIDRACSGADADNPQKIDVTDQTRFVFRDFYAIYFLAKFNPTDKNGIVLLDNWFKSTGATAEFNLGKWLNLTFYEPDGTLYFAGDGKCPKECTSNEGQLKRLHDYDGDWVPHNRTASDKSGAFWRVNGADIKFFTRADDPLPQETSLPDVIDRIKAGAFIRRV